jgi:ASC-1-like (ASCH) protein
MNYTMKLQPKPFEQIKNGTKVIEMRLNDEKRQRLLVEDTIDFLLAENLNEKVGAKIVGLEVFKTFKNLCDAFPPASYGASSSDEYISMSKYYSKEDEEKYGVLAIKIELL